MTTAVGLGAAMVIAAGPAAAARPDLPQQVGTTHILVHYTTTGLDAITEQLAQSTANDAENAYGIYEGLGFRPPVSDGVLGGDGRVDVYMTQADLTSIEGGLADGDVAIGRPWGWIQLRPAAAVFKALVAHELFHLVEFAYNRYEASWLMESGAEWAAGVVEGGGTIPPVVGSFCCRLVILRSTAPRAIHMFGRRFSIYSPRATASA